MAFRWAESSFQKRQERPTKGLKLGAAFVMPMLMPVSSSRLGVSLIGAEKSEHLSPEA
jgi:hypothetical protein